MATQYAIPDVSLEAFSKVVEAIYDCALDPPRWHDVVRKIAELSVSQVCFLGVHDYTNARSELSFQWGYDEHYIRLHEEKYKNMDPFFVAGQLVPVGTVTTQAMLVDEEEFYQSRFYREWCKPQGLHDMINFKILKTDQRIGWLAANRNDAFPRYGEADISLFGQLAPHVCRSIAISDALSLKKVRCEALEATLDSLLVGVYLTDRYSRVVYMNPAAERQVSTGQAMRVDNDRLAPVNQAADFSMRRAIAQATGDESEPPVGGMTIALPSREGRGLVATILPLTQGQRRNVCGAFAAAVAVFVQDPVAAPPFPGEAFAKLYGLTGSELRTLLAVAPGLSVHEAAEVLGISENTAKTHLKRIYAKTAVSKQTELMQLFAGSAPPVQRK
jgi:DNA-binding CsgD family transcriptional regulator/PAS domain-containing protein